MKKIAIILFLLVFSSIVYSQIYFNERYYFEPYNSWDGADDIIENDSSYIIIGGTGDEYNSSWHRLGFLTISKLGNKFSSKSFGNTTYEYYIQYSGSFRKSGDSNYIAVGARRFYTDSWVHDAGIIYKFDRNLDTIWTTSKTIDKISPIDTAYVFNHFCELNDKSLIIIGSIIVNGETAKALLIKTDSLGNELWRRYFFNGPLNYGINVIQTTDGGFVLSCYLWTFGLYGIAAPYIVKTDSMGTEQWRHYINWFDQKHGPMYLQNSPDSTIVGAYHYSDIINYPATESENRDALIKIDLDSNVIWDKKFGNYEHNKQLKSMNVNAQGRFIITGYKTNAELSQRVGYMLNCNNDGDSLWYREYELLHEDLSNNYLYGVIHTNDGGYLAVGSVVPNPPDTGNQDVWVIKVDSMGCVSFDECWTGVKENIAMHKSQELEIYPNPANEIVNIIIPKENESEHHILVVYNMFGSKAEETAVPLGTSTIQMNVTDWKCGLYTVISSYKGIISGKAKFIVY